jgi:hypothetical protein
MYAFGIFHKLLKRKKRSHAKRVAQLLKKLLNKIKALPTGNAFDSIRLFGRPKYKDVRV